MACGPPRPLRPGEAARTLAHRFAKRVDGLRQLNTRFGLRSRRVFLVWTKYTGAERGEGTEVELHRIEILPTPRVSDLTTIALNPYSAGILPVGSVRVDQISASFSQEQLLGKVPPASPKDGARIDEPNDFFYEIVEDDRESPNPARARFRIMAAPSRQEGNVQWTVVLDRESEDSTPENVHEYPGPAGGNFGGDE